MIYAMSVSTTENKNTISEDTIYTVEYISDTTVTKDTIPVGSLVRLDGMPTEGNYEYIFAQTVMTHIHRPAHKRRPGVMDFNDYILGIHEERITVTGPLVRNKVEALAKGYYGRRK